MNTELMHRVADRLRNLDAKKGEEFWMGEYDRWDPVHDCDSPACIAGWACYVAGTYYYRPGGSNAIGNVDAQATEDLDITEDQAEQLFLLSLIDRTAWQMGSHPGRGDYWWQLSARPGEDGYVSDLHAAACLEHLARTGKVDWDAAWDEMTEREKYT